MSADIRSLIQDAQMVLVGIGEEFYDSHRAKANPEYLAVLELLEEQNKSWMIPLWNYYYLQKNNPSVGKALEKLAEILADKNYYIVSICANGLAEKAGFKQDRLVSPCGSIFKVQCMKHCEGFIREITENELMEACEKLEKKTVADISFGKCPVCGEALCLNNVYTEKYDENGYLPDWAIYTKWLQGTLNRKLCVLELGVNLTYPSVIRWPFEKIGFYNQKATFVRVNESLYQLAEDLKDKGISIPKNSIDWLLTEDLQLKVMKKGMCFFMHKGGRYEHK